MMPLRQLPGDLVAATGTRSSGRTSPGSVLVAADLAVLTAVGTELAAAAWTPSRSARAGRPGWRPYRPAWFEGLQFDSVVLLEPADVATSGP